MVISKKLKVVAITMIICGLGLIVDVSNLNSSICSIAAPMTQDSKKQFLK